MAVSRHIGFELASLANIIKRCSPHHEKEIPDEFTCVQRWFIGYLHMCGGGRDVFQGELEEKFGITRATASSILQRMERTGMIVREPVDYDARLKKIGLTDGTRRHCDSIFREIDHMEARMRAGIPDEDVDTFFRVLDAIKKNLEG